jgi:hypothetical protein
MITLAKIACSLVVLAGWVFIVGLVIKLLCE